jgi:hypothetical protein
LRLAVLVLAGAEILLVACFGAFMLWTNDPLGIAIGRAVSALVAVPAMLLILPAVILGLIDRWLPLALLLLLAAMPAALLVLRHG